MTRKILLCIINVSIEKGGALAVAILTGEYHHQIDEKNRIRIPAKLKEALGSSPMIARGSNGCLFVFSKERAEKMFESTFNSDDFDESKTRALRLMASSAAFPEEDKQGRIQLPASLIKAAGIEKNVVTIGAYDRVEIWSEERWNAYVADGDMSFDECLRSLKNR